MVAGSSSLNQLEDAGAMCSSSTFPAVTYALLIVVTLISAKFCYQQGVHQAVSKIRQEIDKQSSSLKSLHMRLETSAQKHQDLSSQFEGLQLQVDATTESQKLLQHLSGVLHELRGHLQVSLEGQEMMRDQAASLAKLKAQVSMQQSSQLELKRQADEINELRKRLVSSNESIKHITLTQKALAEKANMLDEQDPLVSPFAIWAASQSKLEFECSEQSADDVSTGAKSEHQEGSMTRTVSAKTDVVGQCERATSGGCSATSPALTPASSVQGLSLLAAHPNRVVSPAPTVTGSSPSLTRPYSSQSPNSPNSRMNPKGKAFPPSVQPRRRSTNSRRSMGAAPNLDIQRVQGLSQLRMQSPFGMEAASQQSEMDALQEKIVMEETQPSVPVQATHTIEKTKSWMKFYRRKRPSS